MQHDGRLDNATGARKPAANAPKRADDLRVRGHTGGSGIQPRELARSIASTKPSSAWLRRAATDTTSSNAVSAQTLDLRLAASGTATAGTTRGHLNAEPFRSRRTAGGGTTKARKVHAFAGAVSTGLRSASSLVCVARSIRSSATRSPDTRVWVAELRLTVARWPSTRTPMGRARRAAEPADGETARC